MTPSNIPTTALEGEEGTVPSNETGTGHTVDLHAAIMNLPCNVPKAYAPGKADEAVYRIGHRDARHAAAELAAADAAGKAELLEALRQLLRAFPTDHDMVAAGWNHRETEEACTAYDKARTVFARATGATK